MHLLERVILLQSDLLMMLQFVKVFGNNMVRRFNCISIRKGAEDERNVFGNYYEYEEPLKKIVPHRVLALNRGEKEEVLRVGISFPTERIIWWN